MTLTPMEVAELLREAGEIVSALNRALHRDIDTGVVRLDRDERRDLLRRLGTLTAHLIRDVLD